MLPYLSCEQKEICQWIITHFVESLVPHNNNKITSDETLLLGYSFLEKKNIV